ncbi:MAG: hypothetical protein ACYDH5_17925 [Acidimicrobiales bacterium]
MALGRRRCTRPLCRRRTSLPDLEDAIAELATTGLQHGAHLFLSANRWLDIRPQLLDAMGTRLELRLGDPIDSLASRLAASRLTGSSPGPGLALGRGSLGEAVAMATEAAGQLTAPKIVLLPKRLTTPEVSALATAAGSPPPSPSRGFLLGAAEFRSRPVQLRLLDDGFNLVLFGDCASGRTTVLRRCVRHLHERFSPDDVLLHVVDPRRTMLELARQQRVDSYSANAEAAAQMAGELAAALAPRLPAGDIDLTDLTDPAAGPAWTGPKHVLVVDGYDLLLSRGPTYRAGRPASSRRRDRPPRPAGQEGDRGLPQCPRHLQPATAGDVPDRARPVRPAGGGARRGRRLCTPPAAGQMPACPAWLPGLRRPVLHRRRSRTPAGRRWSRLGRACGDRAGAQPATARLERGGAGGGLGIMTATGSDTGRMNASPVLLLTVRGIKGQVELAVRSDMTIGQLAHSAENIIRTTTAGARAVLGPDTPGRSSLSLAQELTLQQAEVLDGDILDVSSSLGTAGGPHGSAGDRS